MNVPFSYSKENIDAIFKELGKEFRKLNGTQIPAEITLVGGAAIVIEFGFRDSTTDIDALIKASSAMKDAINHIGDKHQFANGWLNQDFKNTTSYSNKIQRYSVHYRTFSNIMDVRILPAEYLVAMKLMSFRDYKHDKSDIVGIIAESNITKQEIVNAVENLYSSWDSLSQPEAARQFIDAIYRVPDKMTLLKDIQNIESENSELLKQIDQKYDILQESNVDDILKKAKKAQERKTLKKADITNKSKALFSFDELIQSASNKSLHQSEPQHNRNDDFE